MDPDANLTEQLTIADRWLNVEEPAEGTDIVRMAELVTELDDWIRKGGTLPKAWQR